MNAPKVRVVVRYRLGHSINETWVYEPETFCPHCGTKQVWCKDSPGDFFRATYLCLGCESWGYRWYSGMYQEEDLQRVDQIRAGLKA